MDNYAKGRLLVTIQFLLLGGLVLVASDDLLSEISYINSLGTVIEFIGFAIVILGFRGLGKSLTANPVPIKQGKLITKGIYSKVRHPIYLGLLIATFGIALVNGSVIKFVFWILLLSLLIFKIKFEEALLVNKYPNYLEYKKQVPAIFPKIRS